MRTFAAVGIIATMIGCRTPATSPDTAALTRAATTLRVAVDQGVSYHRYGELIQAFDVELSLSKGRIAAADLAAYEQALATYKDGALVWMLTNDLGKEFAVLPTVKTLVTKYQVPTVDKYGETYVSGEALRHKIWTTAQTQLPTQ